MFRAINLQKELILERSRERKLLDEVHGILTSSEQSEQEILNRLKATGKIAAPLLSDAASERIFTLSQIRGICIRYRLRFLDSKYFKSDYPYDAILAIKDFERQQNMRVERFKILAPDSLFHLENINKDPLLFAELSDGNYFLLHQWGNDLHWSRKLKSWPLQNFSRYFVTLLITCFACSFLLPTSILNVFNLQSEIYLRIWFSLHLFIGFMGMTLWFGLTFDKTFSDQNWDSKFYNY